MYNKVFKKIKKLQTKIVLTMIAMAIGMGAIVGVFGTAVTRYSTTDALEKTLTETTELAAVSAQKSMQVHRELIKYIANEEILRSDTADWQEKYTFLRQCSDDLSYLDAYIFDTNGMDPIGGYEAGTMDYFLFPMKGETYVSSPYPKYGSEGMYIVVSTPVYSNSGEIIAVICLSIDQMVFQEIAESVAVGNSENGMVYVLDKHGTTVASTTYEDVIAQLNLVNGDEEQRAGVNPVRIEIEGKMISGASGVETWTDGGTKYLQAYAPIEGSDGWSIAVTIELAEFLKTSENATILLLGIILLLLVLCSLFALYIGKSIAAPITTCSDRLRLLAEGDLKSPVPAAVGQDEVAALASSTAELIDSFSHIVEEVDATLSCIADGDLTRDVGTADYPGDFASLKKNLVVIGAQLNQTVGNISDASNQVYSSSQQVLHAAQSMAQGATEQAASIEELSATVTDVSDRVKRTADNAAVANQTSGEAEGKLMDCNSQMNQLVSAMEDINKQSDEISKIIKVIEDISFQTNILALNAAVEAARAGAAGKGFAVVADEVRNLAGKSAEASKNTSALIENSVVSVRNGMKILHQTEEALGEVVAAARRSAELVGEISGDANEQATAIGQITDTIEQIVSVIQMTSATAEESAATSEVLSNQSQTLKQAVDQFRLKDQTSGSFLR